MLLEPHMALQAQVFELKGGSGAEIQELLAMTGKEKASPGSSLLKVENEPRKKETPAGSSLLSPHNWLSIAFGDIVNKSQPKAYLFKLLEFNKIEVT